MSRTTQSWEYLVSASHLALVVGYMRMNTKRFLWILGSMGLTWFALREWADLWATGLDMRSVVSAPLSALLAICFWVFGASELAQAKLTGAVIDECPQCGYRVDYSHDVCRCPECGLEFGEDAIALVGDRWHPVAEKAGHFMSFVLMAVAWAGVTIADNVAWSLTVAICLAVPTWTVAVRIIGFVRFVHQAEFLILNRCGIRWVVQGKKPVSIRWSDIDEVHVTDRFEWIMLRLNAESRVRYVPARFQPSIMTMREFGQVVRDYCSHRENATMEKDGPFGPETRDRRE